MKNSKKRIQHFPPDNAAQVAYIIEEMKCSNCNRELPNKEFITKNGCICCDTEYHRRKKE